MLERSNLPPTNDAHPTLTPPPGFSQGEMVMKKVGKRKKGEENDTNEAGEKQLMAPT